MKIMILKRFIHNFLVIAMAGLILGSCGGKTVSEYHEGNRDDVIDITSLIVSIDDNLPPIHSFAAPIMAGDTLIILDYRSTDLLCTAYDIYNDSTIGRFGKFGAGPGDIGNPLVRFYNKFNNNLYIGSGTTGYISSFYLPEAVSDSTYDAIDRLPMDFNKGILSTRVIDDSTVMCTTYTDLASRDSRISRLNLNTGVITVIDTVAPDVKKKIGITVSVKDNLIFSGDKEHDVIRIFDLDGQLRSIIYGPEYDENVEENDYFFSLSEICGNRVASTYTGRKLEKERSIIILTDLNGRYLKTLRFDETIHGLQYHDKTGRLYLTTTGVPQIGYIELDKIFD